MEMPIVNRLQGNKTMADKTEPNKDCKAEILFLVFLVLKLTDVIDWSWWWVTAPIWIPFSLVALTILILFIGMSIDAWKMNPPSRNGIGWLIGFASCAALGIIAAYPFMLIVFVLVALCIVFVWAISNLMAAKAQLARK